MKTSKKYFQIFVLTIFMALGVSLATFVNVYADYPDPCGSCDYDNETKLEYCNFNYPAGDCGGNNGHDCGGVSC